ncbi:hypothetical protein VCR26J2_370253 [Vibrio coralliirubri]|uniref:type II secretion system protein n=1 Tax=Vibrio coralliirubri TaxID=1516159 RepID=UPI00063372C1|nr:prepilin-type N-terminal cleavage/methylation domain-containing protein [Vibrio coralliirubri]CDT76124.1 hypothetical protein VCR26J2_370253 [Vibrio coralliirubri]
MKQAKGFTLIELIVVIVVLGILAVTAIPKFMDVQSEARIATLKGVGGALHSANGIVYGQAAIQGREKSNEDSDFILTDDGSIFILKGNISLSSSGVESIANAMDTDIHMYDVIDLEWEDKSKVAYKKQGVVFMFDKQVTNTLSYDDVKDSCHMVAYNDGVGGKDDATFRLKNELVTNKC